MSTSTLSAAEQKLNELIKKALEEGDDDEDKKPTMRMWRAKNEKIQELLTSFSREDEWKKNRTELVAHKKEVRCLFHRLNKLMWEQESSLKVWPVIEQDVSKANPGSNEISVIFGGKYVEDPTSIPEELADILVEEATNWNDSRVYTISTTEGAKKSEGKYKHFREDLENEPPFSSTLLNVLEENKGNESRLVLYFTLGRHVGENPFEFNVKVATYFANSLKKNKSALIRLKKNFRVVVTGTEATKPNTALDKKVSIDKTVYIQPTYKIGEGNFMYAMSKICQFYIVAEALVDIFNLTLDSSIDLAGTIEKMKTAIHESKGSGKYADGKYMTYEVLNKISTDWDTIEKTLEQYIRVAPGISICYTPLHANPWTEKALGIESPRAYIIDNIVFRLRNAISNERAARLHLF